MPVPTVAPAPLLPRIPSIFRFNRLFHCIQRIVGLAVSSNTELYLIVYWASDAVGVFLIFFSLQEAFRSVFRNFLGMRWFRCCSQALGLLMIIDCSFAHNFSPPACTQSSSQQLSLLWKSESDSFNLAYLASLSFSSGSFTCAGGNTPSESYLGFGISAAGSLVAYLLRSEFGTKFDPVVRIAPPIAYIIAVAIWLATFLRGSQRSRPRAGILRLHPSK